MLATFRNYIRSTPHRAGRSGLWFVYGIAVIVVWLVGRLSQLVRYATKSLTHWTFSGSVTAILAKVTAVLVVSSYLTALAGAQYLASLLVGLAFFPMVAFGFAMVIKGIRWA